MHPVDMLSQLQGLICFCLTLNCLISDLYGHLHGFVIIVHPKELPFVDFPKCTMAQSPGNTRERIKQQ